MDKQKIILYTILIIACLGMGGWWAYLNWLQPETRQNSQATSQLQRLQKARLLIEQNIRDFVPNEEGKNIIDRVAGREDFQRLQDPEIVVPMDPVGNPYPFNIASSTITNTNNQP